MVDALRAAFDSDIWHLTFWNLKFIRRPRPTGAGSFNLHRDTARGWHRQLVAGGLRPGGFSITRQSAAGHSTGGRFQFYTNIT